MTESYEDQLSRVRMMSTDRGATWDLSPNDQAALKSVLEENQYLRERIEAMSEVFIKIRKTVGGSNGFPSSDMPEPPDFEAPWLPCGLLLNIDRVMNQEYLE